MRLGSLFSALRCSLYGLGIAIVACSLALQALFPLQHSPQPVRYDKQNQNVRFFSPVERIPFTLRRIEKNKSAARRANAESHQSVGQICRRIKLKSRQNKSKQETGSDQSLH
jgi:hypothetical protein